MKTRLLIILIFVLSSFLVSYVWGDDLKSSDSLTELDKSFSISQKQVRYNIPYSISNGVIDDVTLYCEYGSILIHLTPQMDSGKLILDVPRSIIDPVFDGKDDRFFILRDGEEIDYEEIPYQNHRKLALLFSGDTSEIEIIHAFIPEQKPETCAIIHDPPYSYILSPLKQFKSGVPNYSVLCKDGLKLLIRTTDGPPACVKGDTASELQTRWNNLTNQKKQ